MSDKMSNIPRPKGNYLSCEHLVKWQLCNNAVNVNNDVQTMLGM